jgi:hypothetical protein
VSENGQMVQGKVNKVGGSSPPSHYLSEVTALWQNKQGYSENATNCSSLEIDTSFSKSSSLPFPDLHAEFTIFS